VSYFAIQNSLCDHGAIYVTTVLMRGQKRTDCSVPDVKIETIRMTKLRRSTPKPKEKVGTEGLQSVSNHSL